MTREQLEKAILLNDELSRLKSMQNAMQEDKDKNWSFYTPITINDFDAPGIVMPEKLCKKFAKAVDETIAEIEKEIEEL